jgi:GTP-binding protein HflX
MASFYETEPQPVRAFLAGVWGKDAGKAEAESLTDELQGLAQSLDLQIAGVEIIHLRQLQSAFGVGSGKAKEIAQKCSELNAGCVIVDWDLSPSQQRNWEELTGIPVLDRRELIIQIFAARARTKEAALQVELARLKFSLPRLTHKYIDLARQRGGSYGAKGSGETKFETDRRIVKERITKLEQEIERVKKQRGIQRKKRQKEQLPVCALVGYTNSGKSSLLNALAGADVLAENKLFATLDTTSRRIAFNADDLGSSDAGQLILIDTVGFIRRLPHDLISAFRSTLEELQYASLLVLVLDSSAADAPEHYHTTMNVLADLGQKDKPVITALNKIDAGVSAETLVNLSALCPSPLPVSAKTGEGLPALLKTMRSMCAAQKF